MNEDPANFSYNKKQLRSSFTLTRENLYKLLKKFIIEYNNMLNDLDSKHVIEHLNFLTGGVEPILMCKCGKTKFCHRHLVAEWLERESGIIIQELNGTDW